MSDQQFFYINANCQINRVQLMQRLAVCCLFIFTFRPTIGQNPRIDSLKMQVAQHAPDSSSVRLLNNLSEWLQYYEDGEALGFAENAYQLAREWKDTLGQAIAARNRCSILHGLAVDDQAILFGLESLDLLSKLDAPAEFAVSQMAVGIVYAEMKEQGAALARFELAEKLFRSIGAAGDARLAQHNRAIIFSDRGDFAQALQLFRDNLAAVEFTEEPYFLAATYNNIGTIYNRKARWDSAAYYFKKAIELKRDLPNKGSKANSHNNLALAMLELGDFKGAQNHLDSALAYALESGEQGREMEIYETRAKLNEALGDFQASVNDLKSVLTLRDTLHSSESALHVSQLSAFYVADAQKDEIELLNKQQEIDAKEKVIFRWLICSLLLVLLLVGGFLALAAKRSRERIRSNNELRGKNEEIERQKQEILVQNEALSEKIEHLAEL
ncbi:MAG TPA: tetratricopeptide repeat protein, partial [Bacteroidetes bacterium]|nr:tetratricopeptide repeat protein [Bacteroidota bacterium]